MWDEVKIRKYLKKNLSEKRYIHSLNVSETCVKLASTYGVDKNKAYIAGLIHDCGKHLQDSDILKLLKKNSIIIDKHFVNTLQIYHGAAGAIISWEEMGVHDTDIYNAVRYHTTGRENMSLLEKIVYIADYIEPTRNFEGVTILRQKVFEDIDEALLLSFNNTIEYVIKRGQLLHLDTIKGRNFIIKYYNK